MSLTAELENETAETKPDPLAVKRQAAVAYMGEKYVLHPNYKFTPRHSFSVTGWQPHSVLRPIQQAAQQAGRI